MRLAELSGVDLRQSYARVGKFALIQHQRYALKAEDYVMQDKGDRSKASEIVDGALYKVVGVCFPSGAPGSFTPIKPLCHRLVRRDPAPAQVTMGDLINPTGPLLPPALFSQVDSAETAARRMKEAAN